MRIGPYNCMLFSMLGKRASKMLSVILFRRWETCAACDAVIAAETRGWSPIPENLRPGRQWGEVTW